ncbi:MAG: RNA polymerase factor sigma-54, partial [Pseudomonadota bacterium]|nr:RNA polymerase factor sigma-54 [Pseudomonadota bacterium]
MKLSLQLKLGQQLTMTPQLQQAIRLLQLSTLDLQQEIHQVLESNPMLELIENNEDEDISFNKESNRNLLNNPTQQPATEPPNNQSLKGEEQGWQEQIPHELAVDSNWEDIYPNTFSSIPSFDPSFSEF